jgi:hypothetical protein
MLYSQVSLPSIPFKLDSSVVLYNSIEEARYTSSIINYTAIGMRACLGTNWHILREELFLFGGFGEVAVDPSAKRLKVRWLRWSCCVEPTPYIVRGLSCSISFLSISLQ